MLKFDDKVALSLPGSKIGILIMRHISPEFSIGNATEAEEISRLKEKYGHLSRKELKKIEPIQSYSTYYKQFSHSYPVLAQLESMLQDKKSLHGKSSLLQTMFLWELDSMLLTAGHDITQLHLPLRLTIASGTESYQSISEKGVTAVNGDMIICDQQNNVISSILRGPDRNSRIKETTTDVLFCVYAPPGIDEDYIKTNLEKLEKRILENSPSATMEMLQVFS